MSILKSAATAKKMVLETLKAREHEMVNLKKIIDTEAQEISTLDMLLEKASATADFKEYRRIKAEQQEKKDSLEMHKTRLNALSEKALISPDDYQMQVAGILDEFSTYEYKIKIALCELAEDMAKLADGLATAMNEANDALHGLQHDLYKDADRAKIKGNCYSATDEKTVNCIETISLGRAGINCYGYKLFKGLDSRSFAPPVITKQAVSAPDPEDHITGESIERGWREVSEELK